MTETIRTLKILDDVFDEEMMRLDNESRNESNDFQTRFVQALIRNSFQQLRLHLIVKQKELLIGGMD